jgi:TPR repeat protein
MGLQLFNRGKEADVARATDLLNKACREDDVYFCGFLGQIVIKWKIEPRFAATQTLLEHACKERDLDSCYVLARALEDGSLGTMDYDRAAALNSASCHQLHYLPSCNALGYMLVLGRGCEKNPLQGAMLFYEACNRGYGPSCDSMGEATEKGWGGPASPAKALPFYDRGCDLGFEDACKRSKELRAAGSGIVEPTGN